MIKTEKDVHVWWSGKEKEQPINLDDLLVLAKQNVEMTTHRQNKYRHDQSTAYGTMLVLMPLWAHILSEIYWLKEKNPSFMSKWNRAIMEKEWSQSFLTDQTHFRVPACSLVEALTGLFKSSKEKDICSAKPPKKSATCIITPPRDFPEFLQLAAHQFKHVEVKGGKGFVLNSKEGLCLFLSDTPDYPDACFDIRVATFTVVDNGHVYLSVRKHRSKSDKQNICCRRDQSLTGRLRFKTEGVEYHWSLGTCRVSSVGCIDLFLEIKSVENIVAERRTATELITSGGKSLKDEQR